MLPILRTAAKKTASYKRLSFIAAQPFRTSAATKSKETGLYGFEQLKSANGFQRFADDAIERAGELVNHISAMPSASEVIRAMDEISDTVCSVVDSAELCRHTHPDREFVEAANDAAMRMGSYIHSLNTNLVLYTAVLKAEQGSDSLNEEAKKAAHSLRIDFEKGGIHLAAEKLEQVNRLNMDISYLCQEFNQNIASDPGYVDIYPASRIPKRLHHLVQPVYRQTSKSSIIGLRADMKEKGYRVLTESGTITSILQWVSDAEVRKMVYVEGNSVPHSNLAVLDKLIAARHELAEIMGCKSYAEFTMHSNMAASPEVVMSSLIEMSELVRPKANEEFEMINIFKREQTGHICEDLEPWDETYYTAEMKSSTGGLDSSVVSSYFPVTQCLKGLNVLVESLFGATLEKIPLSPGESWHPDVIKMSLHHPEEGDLGFLYLDLYSRKGKYPGCAHFAIKGGRKISETEYQLPAVALVCNFSKSSAFRLNHSEVETLFHEFGHALHSLLSRTDYQHFSGTRVALDLAETPSHLFEYFAWDYRFLQTFARHYSTGEVIPEKLVNLMVGAKSMFAATEFQRQVFYALIDQKLFGDLPFPRDTVSIVADLKKSYTSWKHVDGTHWHTRFSHLLNYGAGYYSYLYAKCFAATIWQRLFKEDPLSREAGTVLRGNFLQHGGAKEPINILTDLVGNGIIRHHNGGVIPDLTAVRQEMKL
ncbi:hypothetical protein V2J09_001826 [Rumex salicifolius]